MVEIVLPFLKSVFLWLFFRNAHQVSHLINSVPVKTFLMSFHRFSQCMPGKALETLARISVYRQWIEERDCVLNYFLISCAFLSAISSSLRKSLECSSWSDRFDLLPLCCMHVSGTTAKHVVFLAGNTAKHGLRCKACKMSLHHKCENGVGQQRCMGKLVRCMTQKDARRQDMI